MTKQEIAERVNNFLIEDFEIEASAIRPEAELREDLGIDSLDIVDLVVVVDREFGFRIKQEELKDIITLQNFCDYIAAKTGAA
ncbi:MAG: acyl carrier protein [Paludibacteraceae bacterium]|nr:acyl carrier protein [Paludibacteraceae bacterium]